MARHISSSGRKAPFADPETQAELLRAWAPLTVSLVISLVATVAWAAGQHPLHLLLALLAQ